MRIRLPGAETIKSTPYTGTALRTTTSKMKPGRTGTGFAPSGGESALGSVGELIHHVGKTRPVEPLASLSFAALPVKRAPADFQRTDFFLVGIDLQGQRRSRLCELEVGEVGLDFVLAHRALLDSALFSSRRHTPILHCTGGLSMAGAGVLSGNTALGNL